MSPAAQEATTRQHRRREDREFPPWLAPILATIGISLAAWAHGILWTHNTMLTNQTKDIQYLQEAVKDIRLAAKESNELQRKILTELQRLGRNP